MLHPANRGRASSSCEKSVSILGSVRVSFADHALALASKARRMNRPRDVWVPAAIRPQVIYATRHETSSPKVPSYQNDPLSYPEGLRDMAAGIPCRPLAGTMPLMACVTAFALLAVSGLHALELQLEGKKLEHHDGDGTMQLLTKHAAKALTDLPAQERRGLRSRRRKGEAAVACRPRWGGYEPLCVSLVRTPPRS